jgi:uncharacterized protein (DUF169 family)
MVLKRLQKDYQKFANYFPDVLPAMCWYFSEELPDNSLGLPEDTCMFQYLEKVAQGKSLAFSADSYGCSGAGCYLGFRQPSEKAGSILAYKEKYKESLEYGNAFYSRVNVEQAQARYLIFSQLEQIEEDVDVEVLNLWITPLVLSGLVTLANFDSPNNDNVTAPFASGCQSMWAIPYKEKGKHNPKATIGALDPSMRKHLAADTLLFSLPAERFSKMLHNIERSFACGNNWLNLIGGE